MRSPVHGRDAAGGAGAGAEGPVAVERFLEFFAASISNGRTRAAYGRAVERFLSWCAARGLGLRAIAPLHVAAYIRTHPGSAPTVKQHLAAIRVLCDWLVIHQVLPVNPAAAVRGPKHVVTKGATPVLTPAEPRSLLDGIDAGSLVGLRDRALLSVMVYSFARVSAVVGMRRQECARLTGGGWPVRVRQEEGVTNHLHPESCAGRCEAAGEALTGARTGRAIEHRKRERLERRDCSCGRRPHRHLRDGEGMQGSTVSKKPKHARTSFVGTWEVFIPPRQSNRGRRGKEDSESDGVRNEEVG